MQQQLSAMQNPALVTPCGVRPRSYSRPSCRTAFHRRAACLVPRASASVLASPTSTPAGSRPGTCVSKEARRALFSTALEQVEEVEATVTGTIPDWVAGAYLMNGPGAYHPTTLHLFDGYALIGKLRVEGGRVWGSQRYVQTETYTHFAATGKMKWREFVTPLPAESAFDVARGMLDMVTTLATGGRAFTDNAGVNLLPLPDGTVIASSEPITAQYRIDPARLETLAQVRYGVDVDGVDGDLTTAHPKVLPDGTIVNFARTLPNGGFNVFKQDPHTLRRTLLASIRDREPLAPAWVHDLAATPHHVIVCETPLTFNLPALMLGTQRRFANLDWKPELGTRIHVVALDGSGAVRTFDTPAWFTFHYINAHEARLPSGARVIHVDMCMYEDPEIMNDLLLARLAAFPGVEVSHSSVHRLTIPLDDEPITSGGGGSSRGRRLGVPVPLVKDSGEPAHFFEFPTVAPGVRGQPYRYAYGTTAVRPTNMGNALGKVDVVDGTTHTWHEPGALPGEPVFVPRPGGTQEDDGAVVSNVMLADGRSALVVLNAQTFKELGRATLPFAIPYRFHGAWLPLGADAASAN